MHERNLWPLALVLLLSACGGAKLSNLLESDKVEYKTASKMQPLEIPPDLTRPAANDQFAVPDVNARGQATYSDYSKERTNSGDASKDAVLPVPEGVRIERNGNQRWLVIKGDPKDVWPITRDFWQQAGFTIDTEDAEAGVMETDWVETRAKVADDNVIRNLLNKGLGNSRITTAGPKAAAQRSKFRTRLERGSEPGTTEIYVSHRGLAEAIAENNNGPAQWKSVPPDPDLEAEMLSKLMTRFGVKEQIAKNDANAPAPQTEEKAKLVKSRDGAGVLSVNDQFDRTWRRVGLALDRVGFTVEDRDRSKGLYYVRYADPEGADKAESKGFFSKLNPFSKSEKKVSNDQYRIQVTDADNVSQINVLSKDGGQEKSDTAARILALLYEQLK